MAEIKKPLLKNAWMNQQIMSGYGGPTMNDILEASSTANNPYTSSDISDEILRRQLANTPITPPTPSEQPIPPPPPQGINEDRINEELAKRTAPPTPNQDAIMEEMRREKEAERERLQKYIDAQQGGVNNIADLVNQQGQVQAGYDLSPLMALADSWYGGNLQKGYKAPPSPQDLRNANLSAMEKLQAQRDKLTELATGVEKASGIDYMRLIGAQHKDAIGNGRLTEQQRRSAAQVIKQIKDDPVVAIGSNQDSLIDKALNVLDRAEKTKNFNRLVKADVEKDIVTILNNAKGGVTGLQQQEKFEFDPYSQKLAEVLGKADAMPKDINAPKYVAYLKEMLSGLKGDVAAIREKRVNALTSQYGKAYAGNPYVANTIKEIIKQGTVSKAPATSDGVKAPEDMTDAELEAQYGHLVK